MPRLLLGDCVELVKEIGTDSVDMVMIDPPVFNTNGCQFWAQG